jgi:hypothetical protein
MYRASQTGNSGEKNRIILNSDFRVIAPETHCVSDFHNEKKVLSVFLRSLK